MELSKGDAERYATIVGELVHYHNFDLDTVLDSLRSMTSCSELVQQSSNQILKNKKNDRGGEYRGAECRREWLVMEKGGYSAEEANHFMAAGVQHATLSGGDREDVVSNKYELHRHAVR